MVAMCGLSDLVYMYVHRVHVLIAMFEDMLSSSTTSSSQMPWTPPLPTGQHAISKAMRSQKKALGKDNTKEKTTAKKKQKVGKADTMILTSISYFVEWKGASFCLKTWLHILRPSKRV